MAATGEYANRAPLSKLFDGALAGVKWVWLGLPRFDNILRVHPRTFRVDTRGLQLPVLEVDVTKLTLCVQARQSN